MSEISFGGLATGLPTEDLVSGLMAVERRPLDRLEAEKKYESLRLKAYEQFSAKLDDLRSAVGNLNLSSEVKTTSVRLSSEEDITASSNGASLGIYEIAVAQLAQVQKTVFDGYSSKSAGVLGSGTFSIDGQVININSSNNSLEGLMASINAVSEETGVRASIINDGTSSGNYHLVLTGEDASTNFTVSSDLHDSNSDPVSFTTSLVHSAQQAIAYVDGIEIISNSNTLSDVIAGLTINLNKESEIITPAADGNPAVYKTSILNVEADTGALKEKISTFVSSYNAAMEWIVSGYENADETTVETATDTTSDSTDEEKSLSDYLRGDATIYSIKRNLQSILSDSVGNSGSLQILSEIGISTQKDGTLYMDSNKLDTALESKFDDVTKLLAGDGDIDGVMKKFNSYLLDITSVTDGMYANKRERYDSAVKYIDNQIAQKEPLIAKIELRLRSQFNALELLVSNLNSQGDYLTQQMDMLSNMYNRK